MTVTFNVRIQPKSSRQGVLAIRDDGTVKIGVSAAPENGKANAQLLRLIAEILEIPRSDVSIVSGEQSRNKTIAVEGIHEYDLKKLK